jgi:hypothetical protein
VAQQKEFLMTWTVTVAIQHSNGRVEVITIVDKSLDLITSALDTVPISNYTVLSAKGKRL